MTKLAQLSWMAGSWAGRCGEDPVAELWSAPDCGVMQGMFRWYRDGSLRLSEALWLTEAEGTIVMTLRHFGPDFRAWEAEDAPLKFLLNTFDGTRAEFRQSEVDEVATVVYERAGDRLDITLRHAEPVRELAFALKRVEPGAPLT